MQWPDQPPNEEPASATAVSVTIVPDAYFAAQVVPHAIPTGFEDTMPVPVPLLAMLRLNCNGGGAEATGMSANTAVQVAAAVMVRLVVAEVPAQASDQPANADPAAGIAESETMVLRGKRALQVRPHVMPAGVDATLPAPRPNLLTVRRGCVAENVLDDAFTEMSDATTARQQATRIEK